MRHDMRGGRLIDKLNFFRTERGPASAEEERLMQLFQNRAGLKKAYADLQDEFHLMRDRLKQQEGATIRVQEQLDALGELLADPRTGYDALVFFQLRALWKTCHQRLATFAGELARQQEERESAKFRSQCAAQLTARLATADERLREARDRADELRAALSAGEAEHGRLGAIWHYFRRRDLQRSLQSVRAGVAEADATVRTRQLERNAVVGEGAEAFPGISLAARRTINLAIIGFAELLCEHVDAYGVAAKAKEAVARRVHEMSFGPRADCESYMQRIQKAIAAANVPTQVNSLVKQKLERLRASCEYRNPADTVPTADSLVAAAGRGGATARPAAAASWNVLAEDYWDLYSVLLR
ncbi:MAG TPA: hypothetical protein VND80_00240 [Steroidobacteraceae bacterium]|nr:hypothetical protein [Steroidobacteraceae bacterium]